METVVVIVGQVGLSDYIQKQSEKIQGCADEQ